LRRYDFIIQFAWTPKPRGERLAEPAEGQEGQFEESIPTAAVDDGTGGSTL